MLEKSFNLITIALFVGLSLLYTTYPSISLENGIYENLQLAFLTLALTLGVIGYFKSSSLKDKYILSGLSWLIFAFLLREMEFRGTEAPAALIYITSPVGSAIVTIMTLLLLIAFSFYHLKFCWQAAIDFVKTWHFVRVFLAGLFLILGGIFDREWIPTTHYEFFEEFFETAAYYTLAWAMLNLVFIRQKIN